MTDGFNAPKRGDELSAGPNARIYALESIQDVTGKVKAAIAAAPDALGRANALDDIEKQLVAGCEEGGGYRCRLYSRSEEHTSELQSLMRISYAVFCLKKKIHTTYSTMTERDEMEH